MIGFDVGDNGHHRLQMQKRRVALIRFRDQVTVMAKTGMYARRYYQSAVDEGRSSPASA